MRFIDNILNNITMYRLLLYYLIVLVVVGAIYSLFGILPFNALNFVYSVIFIILVSWVTNTIFAKVFRAQTNLESVYITSLILSLIIQPAQSLNDIFFLASAAVIAMASKYILAIGKKHIFNPAAIAVAITPFVLNQSASWWVGSRSMLPFVLVGGLLLVRKLRRFDLVISFFIVSTLLTLQRSIKDSLVPFFAFVMLVEPLTSPPTRRLRVAYGALIGFLFSSQLPEMSLIIGNIFSYIVSPKDKLILKLKEKTQLTPSIYDFTFIPNKKINFHSGQYMEWTLAHNPTDSRGSRRYFSLASSPTENEIRIGVKFNDSSSSYKKALLLLNDKSSIVASSLDGEFTMPKDINKKLVFIAGGIGVTPYRSMFKYLIDKNEKRDIVFFYAAKTPSDIVYQDIFGQAQKKFGTKVIYVISDPTTAPKNWGGKVGHIDENMIKTEVPDFSQRVFYLSGPRSMVTAFEDTLQKMGIAKNQIVVDYFPGYA